MKGRILAAALAFVLAAAVLAGINIPVARTEQPVEMVVKTSLGDPAAARGLTVDYRIALSKCLRWYTRYDPAGGTNHTDFFVTYRQNNNPVMYYYPLPVNEWQIVSGLLDERDTRDPIVSGILREAASGQGRENSRGTSIIKRLYPSDYYDSYPLRLSDQRTYEEGISPNNGVEYEAVNVPFDKLRIPVTENDFFELEFWIESTEAGRRIAYVSGSGAEYVKNSFTPYCIGGEDGVLTTVGFPADVQPEADWAPEGFGLWYVPVRMQEVTDEGSGPSGTASHSLPVTEECRLVYPLDIETQRVVLLQQSEDGAYVLLVTAENDRYMLRVLDSGDYRLVQQIDLDAATTTQYTATSYVYEYYGAWREPVEPVDYRYRYIDENDHSTAELQVDRTDYLGVTMQQGENFAAVMWGNRLALLAPSAEGYDLQFVCDTVSYGYEMWKDDPADAYWTQSEEADWSFDSGEPVEPSSPTYRDWRVSTVRENYAMAYNGTSLAVATYYGNQLLLSVYGPDGLQYAALVSNSVLGQLGTGSTDPICQDVPRFYQEYYYPQPGLSWS